MHGWNPDKGALKYHFYCAKKLHSDYESFMVHLVISLSSG